MATDDDDEPVRAHAAAPTVAAAPASSAPPTREREPSDRDPRPHRQTERTERADRDRPADDGLTDTIRQRLEHLVPELVKKTITAGMGAVFSTEEGIRKIAREVNIPGVAGYLSSSADGAKDKVFEIIARETREFLSNMNFTEEVAKILTTLSLEVKTEIRFIPNSERLGGAQPDVKASVRIKRAGSEDGEK